MAKMTYIKAGQLESSTLPQLPIASLCLDFINGFCRRGDQCAKSHEICAVPGTTSPMSVGDCLRRNYLSLEPRRVSQIEPLFDDDGPGRLSKYGPRHDNDHINVKNIKILPTTDEILCRRPPYMPKKDQYAAHHYPCGQDRLLDVHFRHLRYENTEALIDACYHASQQLADLTSRPQVSDYDDRESTPRGFQYSMFRDVLFEDIRFNFHKGVTLRVSFACPRALRGRRLGPSKHLEDGMLVGLIGLGQDNALSITFMEILQRQTTDAMKNRTGNDLRG